MHLQRHLVLIGKQFHGLLAGSLNINAGVPGLEPVGTVKFESVKEYMLDMHTLARMYLEPALVYSTTLYGQSVHELNASFMRFCQIWFGCWVAICVIYYLLIARTTFSIIHDSVRNANALLLAIPPDVVMKVPQVKKFLQDVTERNQGITHLDA